MRRDDAGTGGTAAMRGRLGPSLACDLPNPAELAAAVATAGLGLWSLDAQGRIVSVNEAAARALGWSRADLLGRTIASLLMGDEGRRLLGDDAAWRHGVPERLEPRIRRGDGTIGRVVAVVVPRLDGSGRCAGSVGLCLDVTDQARTAEQLRLEHAALTWAPSGVVITDLRGVIRYANPALGRMTGHAPEDLVGSRTSLFKSGVQDDAFYRAMWETIAAGRQWRGRLVNRRADGTRYTEEMTIAPVSDAAGRVDHFVAVKQDVTAQLRLQAEAERRERLELLGRLASSVAHDLNNLLVPLFTGLPVLGAQSLDADAREALDGIEEAAHRAADLAGQVLDFSRGGEGLRAVVRSDEFLETQAAMVKRALPRAVTLRTAWEQGLWPIHADATQLHQVVMNLCLNARDAMPDGGTLALSACNVEKEEEQAGVPRRRRYLQVEVADDGAGIEPDRLPRIFEPFYTTKARGTGLGLATVQRVVEAHGGTVRVASEVGRGTRFSVLIPAAEPGQAS